MSKFKLIAAAVAGLGLFLAGWTARGWMDAPDLAAMTARAEKAETRATELTLANQKLEAANFACNRAAVAQAAASQGAQARRETLDEIMTCPAAQAAVAASQKGEALNDSQDRQMVDFWNRDIFAGLGPGVRP